VLRDCRLLHVNCSACMGVPGTPTAGHITPQRPSSPPPTPSLSLGPPPPPRPPSLTWHPHLDLVEALLDDVCLVPHVAAGHGLQHGPARHGALGQGLVKHLGGLRARLGREARDLNHLLLLAAAAAAVGGGGGAGALAAALLLVLLLVLMLVLLLLCITARGPACR
jgi:hypothetical protein